METPGPAAPPATSAPSPGSERSPAQPAPAQLPAAWFARLVFLAIGAVWGAIGVWSLFDTQGASDALDYRLETNLARFEFRAVYGGMAVAMAAIHAVMATRRGWLGPGLALAGATLLGLASGRVYSMALDGGPGLTGVLLLAMELLMVGAVAVAGFRLGMARGR